MLLELCFCIVSNWGVLSLLGTIVFLMCCVLHPFPRILLESNLCGCIKLYHGLGVAPVGNGLSDVPFLHVWLISYKKQIAASFVQACL